MPVRLNLGAALFAAGRADEAEAVYWDDLRGNPGTGWALYGLLQALKAQGKKNDAAPVEQRFKEAWKDSDMDLGSTAQIHRSDHRLTRGVAMNANHHQSR